MERNILKERASPLNHFIALTVLHYPISSSRLAIEQRIKTYASSLLRSMINVIPMIKVGSKWIFEKEKIGSHIEEFYINLFKEPFKFMPQHEGNNFNHIADEKVDSLERTFNEEEVLASLKSLKDDKAPGPNGFPIKFFEEFWHVQGHEVMKVFKQSIIVLRGVKASMLLSYPSS